MKALSIQWGPQLPDAAPDLASVDEVVDMGPKKISVGMLSGLVGRTVEIRSVSTFWLADWHFDDPALQYAHTIGPMPADDLAVALDRFADTTEAKFGATIPREWR
ncbi:MAG: hypothetical protein WAM30_12565 [Candidatus Dormiibacterota bacterium]